MPRIVLLAVLIFPTVALAQDRPLPPKDAPKAMTLPPGFRATLFAGEPDVVQPIAFAFDDRGRLWVVECLSYPKWRDDRTGHDRVVIFEDTDGDGVFDKKTVFWDKGSNLSGIELGFGGVWLCSTPDLIFIPVENDKPAGPPQVVLDGWDLKAKHNVFNSLTWGPDGWLYGCNGILSNSKIGKPGTPDAQRVAINCGVWRYHPVRKEVEAFAHGTTNPWGLDFDDYGQMFITNCVIHHIWHVVQGAHYKRMFGQDLNPNCYELMPSIADHLHWGGGDWTSSRGGKGIHDAPGGGHAHSGCMVYLGDNWPDEYRNNAFMCNIHGNRVNRDILERRGSTYVAKHAPDVMLANDPWFRGLAIKYGPDGGVYVADWTDTGECHNYEKVDLTNGRIYKITHGTPKPWHDDLSKRSDVELAKLQLHKNDWLVSHARRLLQERAAAGKIDPKAVVELRAILAENPDVTRKLRALWTLHATNHLTALEAAALLSRPNELVRAWGIRLALDGRQPTLELFQMCEALAAKDPSPVVRLALASALPRFALTELPVLANRLLAHAEDAADLYLPLMYWYGSERFGQADGELAFTMLDAAKIPRLREFVVRRLFSMPRQSGDIGPDLERVVRWLAASRQDDANRDVLLAMQDALAGRPKSKAPPSWASTAARLLESSPEIRLRTCCVGVLLNDRDTRRLAISMTRSHLGNSPESPSPLAERQEFLRVLLQRPDADLYELLVDLVKHSVALSEESIRGLAVFSNPEIPDVILKSYGGFKPAQRECAVQTLASRPQFALALLDAVEKGTIPRTDISPFVARQIQSLKNPQASEKLAKVWGTIRPASKDRPALTAKYKAILTDDALKKADPARGKLAFAKTCATCHKLYGEGASIGPDLTGSQRSNLDYILENVLDPSAVVAREYQVVIVELKSGRTLNGIIAKETDRAVTVQTQNEAVVVAKSDIESRTQTNVSMMPEGLFEKLAEEEVRDLVVYLMGPKRK